MGLLHSRGETWLQQRQTRGRGFLQSNTRGTLLSSAVRRVSVIAHTQTHGEVLLAKPSSALAPSAHTVHCWRDDRACTMMLNTILGTESSKLARGKLLAVI